MQSAGNNGGKGNSKRSDMIKDKWEICVETQSAEFSTNWE